MNSYISKISKKNSTGICLICGNIANKILTYETHGSKVNETYCDSCFQKRKRISAVKK